jgi:hypothetical protein
VYSKHHYHYSEESGNEIINHDAKTLLNDLRWMDMILVDKVFLEVLIHTIDGPWFGGIKNSKD